MMKSNTSYNSLVSCNVLNRVSSLLESGSRVQLTNDTLDSIRAYLVKVCSLIDESIPDMLICKNSFSDMISNINQVLDDENFVSTSVDMKEYIVSRLESSIVEFKIATGVYLTDHDFEYKRGMDTVLQDIVDTCISNNYYFGY